MAIWICVPVLSVMLCINSDRVVVVRVFLLRESKIMFAAGKWDISPQLDSLSLCHRSHWVRLFLFDSPF